MFANCGPYLCKRNLNRLHSLMKKLVLLFMLAITPLLWLHAQSTSWTASIPGNEILWQLDSLLPCHHFQPLLGSKYSRDSLNVHHFPVDSLPWCSSDLIAQRLKKITTPIDLAYNEDVQAFINLYVLQRREQVERMLGLSYIYFPIFDEVLDRENVPMEIRYLPIVESALNPHARSRCGATGLWQFMLGTGNMYNLDVTSYVDERRDPFKSTEAAVKYLKNMYKTYGDWLLVVAAYNCGPGNVNKAIARSGGKRTFWEIQEFLPRETRSYVPALIAATYVFNYSAEHNLFPRMVDFSLNQDTIHYYGPRLSLKHFADLTQTDLWTLKDLNPELKIDIIPNAIEEAYVLRVPMKTGQFFAAYRDSIVTLAAKLNIDSARAVYSDANISPLTNKPYVAEASELPTYATSSNSGEGKSVIYHKVRRGDVVGSIAARYHVSAKDIQKWNGLRGYNIQVGQNLKIMSKAPMASATKPKEVVKPAAPVVIAEQPMADPSSVVDPKAVVVAKVEPKVDPKAVVVAKAEPKVVEVAKVDPKAVVVAKSEPKVGEVAKVDPKAVVVAKAEPKVDPKAVVVAKTDPKVDPKVVAAAKTDPKLAVVPKIDPKAVVVAKTEPVPIKITPKTTAADLGERYHVVRQGDTLWEIANAYNGLTVDKLKSLNALADNKLEVGQKLRVQ